MMKSNLDASSLAVDCERSAKFQRHASSSYVALRLLAELYILILLSILAGYSLIYETTDSVEYSNNYSAITTDAIFGDNGGYEPFYNLSAAVAKLILGVDYNIFASILAFVALSIKFYLFSQGQNSTKIKIAYLCTLYLVFECLLLRNAVALSFAFLAFELREKKVRSWLLIGIGCATHYSMFLLVPALFFYKQIEKKENLKKIFVLQSVTLVLVIPFLLIQLQAYDRFYNYILSNPDYFNIWGIPRIVILFLILYFCYKNRNQLDNNSRLILYIVLLCTGIAFLLFQIPLASIRLVDFAIFATSLLFGKKPLATSRVGHILFWSLISESIFSFTLAGPQFIVALIKS